MSYFLSIILLSMMTHTEQNPPKKILFFGDSITEGGVHQGGYISLLQSKLDDAGKSTEYQLIGSGIGGNKVYDLFFRMEKDVLAQQPDVVVIWVGVNDVWHKSSFGTGTDLHKFELMYADIIGRLQAKGIEVYCCTPACIGEKTDHSNAQDGDLNEYSKSIRRVASEKKTGLIDFRKAFLGYNLVNNTSNAYQGILTNDGVHLTTTGSRIVADMMWDSVIK
jgi:isoamyl acetate esterase